MIDHHAHAVLWFCEQDAAARASASPAGPPPASPQDPQHPPHQPPAPQARPDPAASGRSDAPAGLPPRETVELRIDAELLRNLLRKGAVVDMPPTHLLNPCRLADGVPSDGEIRGANYDARTNEVTLWLTTRDEGFSVRRLWVRPT